jgi:hypothetical protein
MKYIADEERDNMEEQQAIFHGHIGLVENEDIKLELYNVERIIFNPFVCDAVKYGEDKRKETQDTIKEFRKRHPYFEIEFERYGIREEK